MRRFDVGHDQARHGRARRGRGEPRAERDRGRGARGRELDAAKAFQRGGVVVQPPTQALVELLGPVDVGHGDDVDLELHVDLPDRGVEARGLCFGGAHDNLLVAWMVARATASPYAQAVSRNAAAQRDRCARAGVRSGAEHRDAQRAAGLPRGVEDACGEPQSEARPACHGEARHGRHRERGEADRHGADEQEPRGWRLFPFRATSVAPTAPDVSPATTTRHSPSRGTSRPASSAIAAVTTVIGSRAKPVSSASNPRSRLQADGQAEDAAVRQKLNRKPIATAVVKVAVPEDGGVDQRSAYRSLEEHERRRSPGLRRCRARASHPPPSRARRR